MQVLRSLHDLQRWRHSSDASVHFVPTMGGLHHGHASLISAASCPQSGEAETLVSVFVNPLQFGPDEDFARYPRTFDDDCELAELSGASAIWCPDEPQIYPGGLVESWRIQAPKSLQSRLCGSMRPGHFDGVVTVVCRLLALAKPHQLFLGEKDWQQLTILRRMVLDLGLAVRVRSVPTVRDGDGLASSSRNRYLNVQERQQGVLFAQVLSDASSACLHGGTALNPVEVRRRLEEVGLSVEYVDVVDPWLLQPSKSNQSSLTLLAAAVRCGSTRLIDHAFLMTRSPLVAIDGPAGAGKSTVTRAFAERLGLVYLDTGAMYRAVTWLVLEQGFDPADSEAVEGVLSDLEVQLEPLQQGVQAVRVNGHEVTDAIRDPRVTASVSAVAAHGCVRAAMTAQQQRMGEAGGLVAEGRDIGTAVFPDAELKVFLTATPKERARRRALDLEARGHEVPALPELEAQIVERDRLDSTREVAPLLQADDAIELISDGMSIDQVIDALEDLFRRRVGEEVWPTPSSR
ncbi:bifunctional pantoate--beta-alanine ligase/(d)CMP kinase [Synechococcus sp. MU1655]|uniref:bifunctional pantoate--beta-alanine ligase/(d)CMP kinase n=1 Tax=Synechococcus sp. MU1655 TaxID=2508355 RepID=UPI0033063ADE